MTIISKRAAAAAATLATVVLLGAGCSSSTPASLTLPENTVEAGQAITVNFVTPGDFSPKAWVGIIPSDVAHGDETFNDQYDLSYEYLNERTSGAITLYAPSTPGSYDFRMFDTDENGKEVASVSFSVTAPSTIIEPTVTLSKTTYAPGDTITVTFTAPATYDTSAWVGLVPSSVAHGSGDDADAADLDYDYLSKRTSGTMDFTAPEEKGSYDLRMIDQSFGGKEVASVTFTVK